jgi:hypothetical protein
MSIFNVFFGIALRRVLLQLHHAAVFLMVIKVVEAPCPLTPPPQCWCKLFYGAFYFVFLPAIDVDFVPLGLAGDELLFS